MLLNVDCKIYLVILFCVQYQISKCNFVTQHALKTSVKKYYKTFAIHFTTHKAINHIKIEIYYHINLLIIYYIVHSPHFINFLFYFCTLQTTCIFKKDTIKTNHIIKSELLAR